MNDYTGSSHGSKAGVSTAEVNSGQRSVLQGFIVLSARQHRDSVPGNECFDLG